LTESEDGIAAQKCVTLTVVTASK